MKSRKALIFGSGGQDGYYLDSLLQEASIIVINISRKKGNVIGDVADIKFVEEQIKFHQPDYIFHFAANSTAHHSALIENHNSISTGTLNILESVRLYSPRTKVFISGSALQFKNEGLPINEQTPFDATSPYAVARIQSVFAARYFHKTFGIKAYVGYFFHHDSPLRSEQHVNQKVVQTAKRIAGGSSEKLILGNIDVQKEFNFAGDMMEAVWKFIQQDEVFELVLGSGKAYKLEEWVSACFDKLGIKWKDAVVLKDNFIPEYKILVSDPRELMKLDWKPAVDFNELLNMMINE